MDRAQEKSWRQRVRTRGIHPRRWLLGVCVLGLFAVRSEAVAQDQARDARQAPQSGYLFRVPLPLRGQEADDFLARLVQLAQQVDETATRRPTVILQFGGMGATGRDRGAGESSGEGSRFEDALGLARFLAGPQSKRLRFLAFVAGPVRGHAILPILACDEFAVAPGASMANAAIDERQVDAAIVSVYQAIAEGRGTLPVPVAGALVDPSKSLFRVTLVDGTEKFVDSAQLLQLRGEGLIFKEEQWTAEGSGLELSAQQLRGNRWASQVVASPVEWAALLGIADLQQSAGESKTTSQPRLVELSGELTARKLSRLTSSLQGAVQGQQVDALLVVIDSPGGAMRDSLSLSLTLCDPNDTVVRATGYVTSEARGDALLVACSCRPLYMHPSAVLGRQGASYLDREALGDLKEVLEELGSQSGRSAALLRGLLDPDLVVHKYVHRRTGQVGYFAVDATPEDEGVWERGEVVDLASGLTANQAIAMGLAEGTSESLAGAAALAGMEGVPSPLTDRAVVRAIERLAEFPWLPQLLIFAGFLTLSMELSAPGLGLPGFLSLLSFMLFFWISFFSGTAEWLEILLFGGGIACLVLEIFFLPGVGVFGIGGLVMVVGAIVLTSQTFVIPQNDYQFRQTTRGLMTVIAAFAGIAGGLLALRYFLPGTRLYSQLVMPGPRSTEMMEQQEREHLVHYEWLLGHEGTAITPLRPAGKARFADQIFAVVSQGEMLEPDAPIRVVLVQGNRIVVESLGDRALQEGD